MNKKVLYSIIGLITLAMLAIGFILFNKSKSKDLILTIDKTFFAYSSFIIDLGYSPKNIQELYENNSRSNKWKGPYISKSTLHNYKEGNIDIIHASRIPTKKCSLNYKANCFAWIKVTNVASSDFKQIKDDLNEKASIFFANNNLYFKVSAVE